MKIGLNDLVKRHTKDSKYSHFDGTLEKLAEMVKENFDNQKPGYRDGVVLVALNPEGFFSGVAELTLDMTLKASFSARRKGEEPYVQFEAIDAEKLPAKYVEVVLYRHDVLEKDACTDAEWEIISINARPTDEEEPISPYTMARNFLGLPGGTKAEYTAEEFAKAIIYWSKHAMIAGK